MMELMRIVFPWLLSAFLLGWIGGSALTAIRWRIISDGWKELFVKLKDHCLAHGLLKGYDVHEEESAPESSASDLIGRK